MAVPTNQTILDAIQTEIHARITGTSAPEYTMQQGDTLRRLKKLSDETLFQLRREYQSLVQQETVAASGSLHAYASLKRPA